MRAVADVKSLLATNEGVKLKTCWNLSAAFAGTWFSLDAYDEGSLPRSRASRKQITFTAEELKAAYPRLQEKAAHLLCFIVKDHPFTDGNKRSGTFAFV